MKFVVALLSFAALAYAKPNPQLLLTHPYAYAHYVPTTYVAPTVFNHENHPSTVLTASGHHVYAAPWVVAAKPEAERKKREADPQLLLTHPYAYAHYIPTTQVAPTVFNHENHPSTVLTASGHHVYADSGKYKVQKMVNVVLKDRPLQARQILICFSTLIQPGSPVCELWR